MKESLHACSDFHVMISHESERASVVVFRAADSSVKDRRDYEQIVD